MKERPILFSGEMVKAILDGRKTQTRRVIECCDAQAFRAQGYATPCSCADLRCRYGVSEDRLWVKETCFIWGRWRKDGLTKSGSQRWRFKIETPHTVVFDPKHPQVATKKTPRERCMYWRRPSIFMPRWASRITLEITAVRVQRLQEISEEDAEAEGVEKLGSFPDITPWRNYSLKPGQPHCLNFSIARRSFETLWDSINTKKHPWASNPWVWAISFRRVQP